MSPTAVTSSPGLADRQRAIAAAFRAARDVPHLQAVSRRPATAQSGPVAPAADALMVEALRAEMRRLTERLERVENKVDLIRDSDEEAPLAWPVEVETDNRLEVPPLEVKRSNSPAFDVLLGPPALRADSA